MTAHFFLVTGGAGFIGAGIVKRLLQAGHRVRVLDDNSRGTGRRLPADSDRLEIIRADVRDRDAVARACAGVRTVVHLAAVNGTEFFYTKPELVLDVGIRGMLAIIDGCRTNRVQDLIVASSSEVYQTPPAIPTDERVPLVIPDVLNPRYSYAGSKILSELVAVNYGRTGFARVAIVRPHNVYGPDMGWEHVIPQFALRALDAISAQPSGKVRFEIQGDGRQTRAFVHIDDFTEGLMRVIDAGRHLEIYHIGNPEEVSMAQLAKLVLAHFGREPDLIPVAEPSGASKRRCPDISKLSGLGYAPRIGLRQGLPETLNWYAANADLRHRQSAT